MDKILKPHHKHPLNPPATPLPKPPSPALHTPRRQAAVHPPRRAGGGVGSLHARSARAGGAVREPRAVPLRLPGARRLPLPGRQVQRALGRRGRRRRGLKNTQTTKTESARCGEMRRRVRTTRHPSFFTALSNPPCLLDVHMRARERARGRAGRARPVAAAGGGRPDAPEIKCGYVPWRDWVIPPGAQRSSRRASGLCC